MKEDEGIMILLKVIDNMLEDSKAFERQVSPLREARQVKYTQQRAIEFKKKFMEVLSARISNWPPDTKFTLREIMDFAEWSWVDAWRKRNAREY